MIYVTSINGLQVEPLINIGTDFKMEQSTDGSFSISFSCFPSENNPGYNILRSESVITVDGNDFKVKQYSDTGFSKTVTATSIFFELTKIQKVGIFSQPHTIINHLNFTFTGSGWNYSTDSSISNLSLTLENFGDDNVISLVNDLCRAYEIEYIILPNKVVHFARQIGPDSDYQYRYKSNLSDVVLTEDTTNLYTFIRGYGAEGLEVSYTSPNLSVFGRLEAAPIRDDRFTNSSSLLNYIKNSIKDVPDLAIESRIPELTSRETGERIWLIYEPLGIEMNTRILKQTKILINDKLITQSVIFGNTLIKSSIDLLVEQRQEIQDTKNYINETNDNVIESQNEYRSRFDVTDRNITLQVERLDQSIATIDIKADNINLSVNNRITNEVAAIDIRANQIALSVQNLDTRTSSSINLLENNINLKIDKGGAITDINLSPGQATINADRINLNGAVVVNGNITGATLIQVSTDIDLGRRIRFNDFTAISSSGGVIDIEAINGIIYTGATHTFNGIVDFSNATVIGI